MEATTETGRRPEAGRPVPNGRISSIREELLAGLVMKDELAEVLERSTRTVDRLVLQGLPFLQIGAQRRFDIEKVREWLRSRCAREQRSQPQKRGRPKRIGAAPASARNGHRGSAKKACP
jgi:excisionase family DNA binding protein